MFLSYAGQGLVELPNIPAEVTGLDVCENALITLEGLPAGLVELDAAFNDLRTLEGLAGCTRLRSLNVGHNQITDLNPLLFCPELQTLAVSGNVGIQDLKVLMQLPDLRQLYIKKLRCAIPVLPQIKELFCTITTPELPEGLLACKNIRTLHIHSQTLASIAGIERLDQLKTLTVIGLTHVQDLTPLKACNNLQEIKWPHNCSKK